MSAERNEICAVLDKLTLELFELIEQQVQCKLQVEHTTSEGNIQLAKARYIKGQQAVSTIQLPTENSEEFSALTTLKKTQATDSLCDYNYEIDIKKANREINETDPINWFGVLVPSSLHTAQSLFKKALELVTECANIQGQLSSTIKTILQLNEHKKQLI